MDSTAAIAAFSALAQETRLAIFRLLVRQGPAGLAAGRIAERLAIPPNTLSFHLAHLAQAGLVEARREGRVIHYSLRESGIRDLIAYLVEDCCKDRPELCGPSPGAGACCGPAPDRREALVKKSARTPGRTGGR